MKTVSPTKANEQFQVISNLLSAQNPLNFWNRIAEVMSLSRSNLDRIEIQILQDLLGTNSHALMGQGSKTFVHVQTSFGCSRRIIVSCLIRKQCGRELPELGWVDSFNGKGGFMRHGRRRVPRLDTVAEDKADVGEVFLKCREDVLEWIRLTVGNLGCTS